MYCDIVARGSLRGQRWFLEDVGMEVLLRRELFAKVELAEHLDYMLPMVILHFSGFIEGHIGAVGVRCQSSAEGQSVSQRMVWDDLPVSLLFSDEHQRFIVCIHLCPFWDKIMIFCLLCPMMGQQEAHLRIRYIFAVWDFDEVHPSFVICNMELECACALDV